jgi:hypothetical protein
LKRRIFLGKGQDSWTSKPRIQNPRRYPVGYIVLSLYSKFQPCRCRNGEKKSNRRTDGRHNDFSRALFYLFYLIVFCDWCWLMSFSNEIGLKTVKTHSLHSLARVPSKNFKHFGIRTKNYFETIFFTFNRNFRVSILENCPQIVSEFQYSNFQVSQGYPSHLKSKWNYKTVRNIEIKKSDALVERV